MDADGRSLQLSQSCCVNGRRAVCVHTVDSPLGLSKYQSSKSLLVAHAAVKGSCKVGDKPCPCPQQGAGSSWPRAGVRTLPTILQLAPSAPPLTITAELGWQPSSPSESQQAVLQKQQHKLITCSSPSFPLVGRIVSHIFFHSILFCIAC